MNLRRRPLAAVTHSGPGYDPAPLLPARGDAVEAWLKALRDTSSSWSDWYALDAALNRYRRHADSETPLDQRLDADVPF